MANIVKKITEMLGAHKQALTEIKSDLDQIESDIVAAENRRYELTRARLTDREIAQRVSDYLDFKTSEATQNGNFVAFAYEGEGFIAPDIDKMFRILVSDMAITQPSVVGALCTLGFRDVIEKSVVAHSVASAEGVGVSRSEREATIASIDRDLEHHQRIFMKLHREAEKIGVHHPIPDAISAEWLLAPEGEL